MLIKNTAQGIFYRIFNSFKAMPVKIQLRRVNHTVKDLEETTYEGRKNGHTWRLLNVNDETDK